MTTGEPSGEGALLQRLFSTFPARWPGIGLLLLRVAVGLSAVAEAVSMLQAGTAAAVSGVASGPFLIAGGLAVLCGFLTPLSALAVAFCAVAVGLGWIPSNAFDVLDDRLAVLFVVLTSIAIALLGPGAYSVDSYLFGRREIVIKRSTSG